MPFPLYGGRCIVIPCFHKWWPLLFLGTLLFPIDGYDHSDESYYLILDHWTKFTHSERHHILCSILPLLWLHNILGQLSQILTNADYSPSLSSLILPNAINRTLDCWKKTSSYCWKCSPPPQLFPQLISLFKAKGPFLAFSFTFQSSLLCSNLAPICGMPS